MKVLHRIDANVSEKTQGSLSSLPRILGGPRTPHWKPQTVMLPSGSRHWAACETKEMILLLVLLYYSCICCQSKCCVLMCVLSDGLSMQPQANGTHKNQMGQAEGRSEHTPHMQTPFPSLYLFFLFIGLSSLSGPLKPQPDLAGVPLWSPWLPFSMPQLPLLASTPSLAGNDGCRGDQSRVCLRPSEPVTWPSGFSFWQ